MTINKFFKIKEYTKTKHIAFYTQYRNSYFSIPQWEYHFAKWYNLPYSG